MGNSVLHAIVIHELRNSNPTFHKEYCTLVDGISQQIRQVTKEHTKAIQHTCFIETFDRSNDEPVLQIVIGMNKNSLQILVHIHKDHHFVIWQDQEQVKAITAAQALEIIQAKMSRVI